jgi:hypothetical protein
MVGRAHWLGSNADEGVMRDTAGLLKCKQAWRAVNGTRAAAYFGSETTNRQPAPTQAFSLVPSALALTCSGASLASVPHFMRSQRQTADGLPTELTSRMSLARRVSRAVSMAPFCWQSSHSHASSSFATCGNNASEAKAIGTPHRPTWFQEHLVAQTAAANVERSGAAIAADEVATHTAQHTPV